jgi:hypothetical protein
MTAESHLAQKIAVFDYFSFGSQICVPAISSGIFGFPLEACSDIHVEAALSFAKSCSSVKTVVLIDFGTCSKPPPSQMIPRRPCPFAIKMIQRAQCAISDT